MRKFNVKLEYWKYTEVEAENVDEALEKAKLETMQDKSDYFTSPDYISNFMEDHFEVSHDVDEIEDL